MSFSNSSLSSGVRQIASNIVCSVTVPKFRYGERLISDVVVPTSSVAAVTWLFLRSESEEK